MLRIFKSLLFSVFFLTASYADILTWGGYTKIDITKNDAQAIIQNYVDKTYPKKVEEYNFKLAEIKKEKLDKVSDITFVHNTLMWQDTYENSKLTLNQLESKRYCKELVLAKRKNWRLPTYRELLELVDYKKAKPASIEVIKYIKSSQYWSDTQKLLKKKQKTKSYWYVDFLKGESGFSDELEMKKVRCVRELSLKKDDY